MKVNNKIMFLGCILVSTFLFFKRSETQSINDFVEYGNLNLKSSHLAERIWAHKESFKNPTQSFFHSKVNVSLEQCCTKVYCSSRVLKQSSISREYMLSVRGEVLDIIQTVECFNLQSR